MEPTLAAGHDDLSGLRLYLLRNATVIYLGLAYPSGVIPSIVQRRLIWRDVSAADELLSSPPFERAGKPPGRPASVYALRLGNHHYPHMKLQIQPWPNIAGFMLSVNSHDQVSGLDAGAEGAQAFRELQAENQRLKEAIEEAWDEAGLPTFLRYLRDYIKSRADASAAQNSDDSVSRGDSGDSPLPA